MQRFLEKKLVGMARRAVRIVQQLLLPLSFSLLMLAPDSKFPAWTLFFSIKKLDF
jgi:hypothetical protein